MSRFALPPARDHSEPGDDAVDVGEVGDAVDEVVNLAVVQVDLGRPEQRHVLRRHGGWGLWKPYKFQKISGAVGTSVC